MKAQKKIHRSIVFTSFIIFGFILSFGFQVYAEEWNAEQKEVWSVIEAGWEKVKNQDAEAMVGNVPDNAVIWWSGGTAPHRVELLKGAYERWFSYEKVTGSELQPLRIEIFDNIAIVAYYASYKSDKRMGKTKNFGTLMKQGDKWVTIGSLSSRCDTPPACMK
jgi:hypothetical protein